MRNINYEKVKITAMENVNCVAGSGDGVLDLNGLYKRWKSQKESWNPRKVKADQFAIQAQTSGVRCVLETLKEFAQVVFIDIDSIPKNVKGTLLEDVTEKILGSAEDIMKESPIIMMQASISGGVHVISFMKDKATSIEDYKSKARLLTADFLKRVQTIIGLDLTAVEKVVDTHNINPIQLFMMSPTPLYVNPSFRGVEPDESLLDEFNMRDGKKAPQSSKERQYTYNAIDAQERVVEAKYRVVRKKASFDHLGDTERFKIASSLKTLIASNSLTQENARQIYYGIMKNNSIVKTDLAGMMRKFDEVMNRKDIRPIIAYNLLKQVGINIIKL